MNKPEQLLHRLDEIGAAFAEKQSALALIGLGSVGIEQDRLDTFSDLDFFVIVKKGSKVQYLEDLSWLMEIAPLAYFFATTPDGYKLLYENGVFCEFAVFNEDELKEATFSPGRVVWKAQGVANGIGMPQRPSERKPPSSTEWLIGDALTNWYVGLLSDRRREKLSAMRFIQGYAVDRILKLAEKLEGASTFARDDFCLERRVEQRFPAMARLLPGFLQGYEKNRESALVILAFLDENFEINLAMKRAVLALFGRMSDAPDAVYN